MRQFLQRYRQCPICDSTWVRSSGPVNWFELKLCPLIGLRAYRCEKCGERYLGRSSQHRADTTQ
jgi:YgiT-type zinc finger domain-containing protein